MAFFVFMYLVRGNPSEEYIIGSIIKTLVSVVMEKEEGEKKERKIKDLHLQQYVMRFIM